MKRRSWILSILGLLFSHLSSGGEGKPRSFVITDRDVSGFIVTDRPPEKKIGVEQKHPEVHEDDKIFLYSASWCTVCKIAKLAIEKEKDLPFVLEVIDVDKDGYPKGFSQLGEDLQTIPHFEWNTPKGRVYTKWKDLKDLVTKWDNTHKKVNEEGLSYRDQKVREGYSPRWTWPGKISDHLKRVHNRDISGLTQDQMEALHDAIHEGRK